jgi:hypothetical protein
MKRFFAVLLIVASLITMPSCNSDKSKTDKKDETTVDKKEVGSESAASIAQEWCDLNGKAFRATTDADKTAAKDALDAFEKSLEEKYKNDETMMKAIEAEVEKCEDASEGK